MKMLFISGLLIGGLIFFGIPSSFAKTSMQAGNHYSDHQEYAMDFDHHHRGRFDRERSDRYFHDDHDRGRRHGWHHRHGRRYDDDCYRDYRYYPAPYPSAYPVPVPVPVAPSGVSIHAHIWIP